MYMDVHEGGRRVCVRPVGLSYKSFKLSICLSVCPSIWTDGWMDGRMDGRTVYVSMSVWICVLPLPGCAHTTFPTSRIQRFGRYEALSGYTLRIYLK